MSFKDWATLIIALFGFGLGIYNAVVAWRKEGRERKEKEAAQQTDDEEWQFYTNMVEGSKEGLVMNPEPGSKEHKLAERLVERGRVERLPGGYYGIPGQRFKLG